MINFTDEERDTLIEELSELYFDRNFGSTSKADLDTLMFSAYIEHCLNSGKPCDDYSLSKELGITQTRVRSMKERKQLKYPHKDFVWEAEFAAAVENAKYDESDHYIKMIIQDINVMNEVRHFIEQRGWYDECSLNRKLLRIPLACFVEICAENGAIEAAFTEEAKANIKKLKHEESTVKAFLQDFTKDGLKSFLMTASAELICEILPILKFTGLAKTAFTFLLRTIEKM